MKGVGKEGEKSNNKLLEFPFAEESSNLLIRKKRVIDKTRNGGLPIQLSRAPYIVNILKNGRSHCAGAILEADIIITTRLCVAEIPGVTFTILSNSALRNNGTPHHIVRRSSNPGFGFGDSFNYFAFIIKKELIEINYLIYNCS